MKALDEAIGEIKEKGYTVLEGLMSAQQIERAREAIVAIEAEAGFGTNAFSGERTVRSSNLVARTRAFDDLITDPRLLTVIEGVLGPDFQLSIATIIKIYPGETPQPLHQDDGLWPVDRPHRPFVLNTLFAIDPFTAENGGTLVVPGSHRSTAPVDQNAAKVSVEMPQGSVLAWDGATWHAGGANTTADQTRCGLNINYNLAWLKQQENQFVGVPQALAATLSPELRRLLGYKVIHRILGGVAGRDPDAVLAERAESLGGGRTV